MLAGHNGLMTNYEQATFNLAGEGNFAGIHDPADTWNGYANPYFTIGEVAKIVSLVGEQNSRSDEATDELKIHEDGSVVYYYGDDGDDEAMPTIVVDGVTHYAIMHYGWCWAVN